VLDEKRAMLVVPFLLSWVRATLITWGERISWVRLYTGVIPVATVRMATMHKDVNGGTQKKYCVGKKVDEMRVMLDPQIVEQRPGNRGDGDISSR
jgi:hypothetical protein